MRSDYDAIIVGGGPAGASAAILLAQAGHAVAVVEKAIFPRRKVCGEFISATTWPLLRELGVADTLKRSTGPTVRRIGLFAGTAQLTAAMALLRNDEIGDGCAVGREVLDTVLLERACAAGAKIWQPWTLAGYAADAAGYTCTIEERGSGRLHTLQAPLLIAAHGSWESGPLPTQDFRTPPRPSDLLGFKAHFREGNLAADLMPLLAFPGGYGGMVHTGAGRISLSCCMRRDQLEACRRRWPQHRAGAAVLAHISMHCAGAAATLSGATLEGAWLAAGPIRPGIRGFGAEGVFTVGNTAAEAHPIVAEGISMAIQSASLLCERLIARRSSALTPAALASIRHDYGRAWRRNFSPRLHAATLYAHLFMRPLSTRMAVAVMERLPSVLTLGARWSGKADALHRPPVTTVADARSGRPG
ncbi:MAG TPA: FAD-dependent monooxygenase [Casimicrobiaceae bacterium]|jgi:flavin-dependent dehydrogenase